MALPVSGYETNAEFLKAKYEEVALTSSARACGAKCGSGTNLRLSCAAPLRRR